MRWEGPGSGFESSFGGASGSVWMFYFSKQNALREFEKWDPDKILDFIKTMLFWKLENHGARTNLGFWKTHCVCLRDFEKWDPGILAKNIPATYPNSLIVEPLQDSVRVSRESL